MNTNSCCCCPRDRLQRSGLHFSLPCTIHSRASIRVHMGKDCHIQMDECQRLLMVDMWTRFASCTHCSSGLGCSPHIINSLAYSKYFTSEILAFYWKSHFSYIHIYFHIFCYFCTCFFKQVSASSYSCCIIWIVKTWI